MRPSVLQTGLCQPSSSPRACPLLWEFSSSQADGILRSASLAAASSLTSGANPLPKPAQQSKLRAASGLLSASRLGPAGLVPHPQDVLEPARQAGCLEPAGPADLLELAGPAHFLELAG